MLSTIIITLKNWNWGGNTLVAHVLGDYNGELACLTRCPVDVRAQTKCTSQGSAQLIDSYTNC